VLGHFQFYELFHASMHPALALNEIRFLILLLRDCHFRKFSVQVYNVSNLHESIPIVLFSINTILRAFYPFIALSQRFGPSKTRGRENDASFEKEVIRFRF
jgi:hypothetical protein